MIYKSVIFSAFFITLSARVIESVKQVCQLLFWVEFLLALLHCLSVFLFLKPLVSCFYLSISQGWFCSLFRCELCWRGQAAFVSQDHIGSTAETKQWQNVESTVSCNFPCEFKIFLFPVSLITFLSQKSSGTSGPLSDEVAALSEQASSIYCGYRNYMPSNWHSDGACFLTLSFHFICAVLHFSCCSFWRNVLQCT